MLAGTEPGDPSSPPLKGVTILELGSFFAAPFGTAMLADMGAWVIKVEPLAGDPFRFLLPMPEVSAIRATQGKESIAVDFSTDQGRDIVLGLARKSDMVLQSYRGGIARHFGLDHTALLALNPNLVYHYGQGYGIDGPYAHRPAYAPVIGAASGFARRNVPDVPERSELSMDEIKRWSSRNGGIRPANPDGFSAYGVGVAMALGLLARSRGAGGQWTMTSMLSTMAHVLSDDAIEYDGRRARPQPDGDYFGYSALERLYETSEGWIVLWVSREREWDALVRALSPLAILAEDARFATPSARAAHDSELVETLGTAFRRQTAVEWEQDSDA